MYAKILAAKSAKLETTKSEYTLVSPRNRLRRSTSQDNIINPSSSPSSDNTSISPELIDPSLLEHVPVRKRPTPPSRRNTLSLNNSSNITPKRPILNRPKRSPPIQRRACPVRPPKRGNEDDNN